MNTKETQNDASETEDPATCDTGQFQKMMDQGCCGCGPMMAKMMSTMATDSEPADGEENSKCC